MLKNIDLYFEFFPLNSELHTIDSNGYLFRLPVDTKEWNAYPRKEWKQVGTASYFTWAVNENGAVYVYVNHENISIRVKEETFENERWIPLKSFGKHLLPTDKPVWSNANGREKRNKEDINLPTSNWQWEGEWRVESTINGEPIEDNDGWTYALDFSADYCGKYFSPCTVRRRKWYRIRYYTAVNKWSKIEPFRNSNRNNFEEAILNVSIGGHRYFDCHRLVLIFVWAVSQSGQVLCRNNVSLMNPEGTNWIMVPNPHDSLVKFVSCGSYPSVWAVLRDGRIVVRYGVTIENCTGTKWLDVPPPNNLEVISIGTGLNVVCVITVDNRVWWRKGIVLESDDITEENIIGSEWVQFGGPKMIQVSVCPRDTIWTIGLENKYLYFKSRVRDLKWHLVQTSVNYDEINSDTLDKSNKFNERSKSSQKFDYRERLIDNIEKIRIEGNVNTNGKEETTSLSTCKGNNYWININAGAVVSKYNGFPFCCRLDKRKNKILNEEYPWRAEILSSLKARPENNIQFKIKEQSSSFLPVDKLACCQCSFDKNNNFKNCIINLKYLPQNLKEMDYVGGYLAVFARDEESNDYFSKIIRFEKIMLISNESVQDFPCMVIHTQRSIEHNTDRFYFHFFSEIELLDWFYLLQQACCEINKTDPICSPNPGSLWLTTKFGDIYVYDYSKLEEYRYAGLFYMDLYHHRIEDTNKYILYNGFPNNSAIRISGYIPYGMKKIETNLVNILNDDILNVTANLKDGILEMKSRIANEWSQSKQTDLGFGSGNYFGFAIIYKDGIFQIRENVLDHFNFQLKVPEFYATHFIVTDCVDVHIVSYSSPDAMLLLSRMFWTKVDGYLSKVKTNGEIVWGLNENHEPWIFTDINKTDFVNNKMTCSKTVQVYENQRWNPIKGFSSPPLPTDRPTWSDETGQVAVNKESYKLPNIFWNWTTPWCIDYDINNGTDNDGWQYAADFSASYHGSKDITDFVRRRRWIRTRELSIEAPWKKVPNLKLKEFCLPEIENPEGDIPIWALTQQGDVFIRKEVTKKNPVGSYWEKVSSPQPVICISSSVYLHVYICSEAGYIYKRWGINSDNPVGDKWACISSPLSNQFKIKKIAVGHASIWAIDNEGSVFINTEIFDGWNYSEINWTKTTGKVDNKFVNIAIKKNHVWAIDADGYLYQRIGVCNSDLMGSFWLKAFMNNVQSING